jgi:hypothetical protein
VGAEAHAPRIREKITSKVRKAKIFLFMVLSFSFFDRIKQNRANDMGVGGIVFSYFQNSLLVIAIKTFYVICKKIISKNSLSLPA